MDDEPVVISSGTGITPESVAIKTFATGFRGYDQAEVRDYLKRVADELTAASAREAELREALERANERAANPYLDDEVLAAALGEQAARLLTNAREAAAGIVSEAEKRAARVVGEAESRIARVRSEADGLLARRSEEADRMTSGLRQAAESAARSLRDRARAEAEAEVESARVQGREMVAEARAVRERMLADLTRRRRTAEVQIEHLRMARQRLLEAYGVVRRTLDEATHELGRAEADAGPVLDAAAGRSPGDRIPDSDSGGGDPLGRGPAPDRRPRRDAIPQNRPAVAAPSAKELAGPLGRGLAHAGASGGSPAPAPSHAGNGTTSHAPPASPPASASAGLTATRPAPDTAPAVARPEQGAPPAAPDDATGARTTTPPPPPPPPAGAEPAAKKPEPVAKTSEPVAKRYEPAPRKVGPAAKKPAPKAGHVEPVVSTTESALPGPGGSAALASADELFARLRAAQVAQVPPREPVPGPAASEPETAEPAIGDAAVPTASPAPDPAGAAVAPEGTPKSVSDESALARRDRLLEPVQFGLVRQLKRGLQDEQNEILDRLRRQRGFIADVLPPLDEHVARYQSAATPFLRQAADRGVAFASSPDAAEVSGDEPPDAPSGREWPVGQWAAELAVDLVLPLRERLKRVLDEAAGSGDAPSSVDVGGVSEKLGATYRQWKTTQIERAARHHCSTALSRGVFAATPDGAARCWVVDDDGPCPDCDDNALAGAVPKGEAFPTGQTHPPAHAGCHCILVPRT